MGANWGGAAQGSVAIGHRYIRINERIRAREVRLIDDEGNQLGIVPPFEGMKLAREKGLDLVEISANAKPPVCRILDYGKYLYQMNKREHEARKHQKSIEVKEVKFRPRTSAHDFMIKKNRIIGFLEDGDKVKATIMFRGRERAHKEIGWDMINRLLKELEDVANVETRPKQEGPNLSAVMAPKKTTGGKGAGPAR